MASEELFEIIIRQYYDSIYRYCYYCLNGDEAAAKDCTQETFLILIEKKRMVDLSGNIEGWLRRTAKNVIRHYLRHERKKRESLDLSQLTDLGKNDRNIERLTEESAFDCLTEAELTLLTAYYNALRGEKKALAEQYGMSLYALYNEIARIKKKLSENLPQIGSDER